MSKILSNRLEDCSSCARRKHCFFVVLLALLAVLWLSFGDKWPLLIGFLVFIVVLIWCAFSFFTMFGAGTNWDEVHDEIFKRKDIVHEAFQRLRALYGKPGKENIISDIQALHMASVDVFIEKAQRLLTRRARRFMVFGTICVVATLSVSIGTGYILFSAMEDFRKPEAITLFIEMNGFTFAIYVIKATTVSAFIAISIYVLLSLARAMIHEGVCCYKQRHALRFGRLVVYMNDGDVDLTDLEEAFGWNKEFSSAFKDIQAERMVSLPVSKVSDMVKEVAAAAFGGGDGEKKGKGSRGW